MTRIKADYAAVLDELADRERGRRRVEVEPDERAGDPRAGVRRLDRAVSVSALLAMD